MKADAGASRGYVSPGSPVRPVVSLLVVSALLAAGTLSVLPFFELLAKRDYEALTIRPAPPTVPEPQVRRPKRVVDETAAEPRRRPELTRSRPRLEPPKHRVEALKARLSLSMSTLSPGMGDVSLDFGVDSGAAGRTVDARDLFELAELDEPPRPIMRMNPAYPRAARQRGTEGFVEVLFTITAEGRVTDLRVLRSDPGDVFVDATLEAVRRWRFTSPRKDGRPVNMRARQIVRFELRE